MGHQIKYEMQIYTKCKYMNKLIKLLIALPFKKSFCVASVHKKISLLVTKFLCSRLDVNRLGIETHEKGEFLGIMTVMSSLWYCVYI
jgi:hypothetical protein